MWRISDMWRILDFLLYMLLKLYEGTTLPPGRLIIFAKKSRTEKKFHLCTFSSTQPLKSKGHAPRTPRTVFRRYRTSPILPNTAF